MSYHEGSNWQAKKEDEKKPLYGKEQFENEVNSRLSPNDTMPTENKWIKVEDRLPEHGQMVDTWNGGANRRTVFMKPDLFVRHVEPFSNERIYTTHFPDITHWMPLPEPPKP